MGKRQAWPPFVMRVRCGTAGSAAVAALMPVGPGAACEADWKGGVGQLGTKVEECEVAMLCPSCLPAPVMSAAHAQRQAPTAANPLHSSQPSSSPC